MHRLSFGCVATLFAMLLLAPGAQAERGATVRFVHALPGAGEATLQAEGRGSSAARRRARFGKASEPVSVAAGEVELSLRTGDSSDEVATAVEELAPGRRYTVVAAGTGDDVRLETYREGRARGGKARVRMIHAAPEVGEADVILGGKKVVRRLDYGVASDYRDVTPGSYDVTVAPAGEDRDPILRVPDVPLNAGTTSSAIVVGSAGQRLSVVAVTDGSASAAGAPDTGLGGSSRAPAPWLWVVVLAGAVAAGALGAALQRSIGGRRTGGGARGG